MKAFSLFPLLIFALAALQGGSSPDKSTLEGRVDRLVRPFLVARDFSGSILIAEADRIALKRSYGMANYELGVSNSTSTKFLIGSVAKQFTAAAILLLQERKLLSLEDPVSRYFKGFPSGDRITLHHLMAHTSGLARDPFPDWRDRREYRGLEEVIAIIGKRPLEFEPGTRGSYSNSGYILLAGVIENVSEKGYPEFLETNIFAPLGMDRSGVLSGREPVAGLATGYDPGAGPLGLVKTPYQDLANSMGAEAIYSTVEDLLRWQRALLGDLLLSRFSRDVMFEDHGFGRGYGVGRYRRFGHPAVGHDGVTHGFTAFLEHYPEKNRTIIYAGNIRSGALSVIQSGLAALALEEEYAPEAPPQLLAGKPPFEEGYLGRYQLFPGFYLEVSDRGRRLLLSGTGGYPTWLAPIGRREFFYRAMYARIRFSRDEAGRVSKLVWIDRRGKEYSAEKVSHGGR